MAEALAAQMAGLAQVRRDVMRSRRQGHLRDTLTTCWWRRRTSQQTSEGAEAGEAGTAGADGGHGGAAGARKRRRGEGESEDTQQRTG